MEKLKQLFTDHYVIPEEWLWVIFGVVVLLLLFFDLFLFNRKNEVPNFWHTLNLCIIYILAACVFGVCGLENGVMGWIKTNKDKAAEAARTSGSGRRADPAEPPTEREEPPDVGI